MSNLTRNCVAVLAFCAVPLLAEEPTDPLTVEIKVYRIHDEAEWPVPSHVSVTGENRAKRTDANGVAVFQMARCDDSVRISARPVMTFLESVSATCNGSPMAMETRPLYTGAVYSILSDPRGLDQALAANPAIARAIEATDNAERLAALQEAYGRGALNEVTRLAGDLTWTLREAAPGAAQSFSVIAMDAGFRTMGIDPNSEDAPLIRFDRSQNLYVMSDLGQAVAAEFTAAANLGDTNPWSGEMMEALGEIDLGSEQDLPLYMPESRDVIRRLEFQLEDQRLIIQR
ncbi:hypothetical protein [Pseudoponticoccus marisrubri]|uniref:DUF306 domain-containing protein n=1 Tax=Pseudoponticoccus marisrubri TaxID=1685382 RepID=A0A0W7WLH4_9RHOB|nr:hypothetical protein [Pseudoponticoccus marisrubri]KUF11433.1 hypothetical protein AVJ23_06615 [Pseudoponticoccus marisrubri]